MPLLSLKCTKEVPGELPAKLSAAVAESIGKPEKYVMVVTKCASVMMSGEADPAAFAEVKSIGGLNRSVNETLTQRICELLDGYLGIPPARVYVTFQSVPADHWGCDGGTFG